MTPTQRRRDAAHVAAHELHHDVQAAQDLLDELADATAGAATDQVRLLTDRLRRSLERLEQDIDRLVVDRGGGLDTLRREPTNLHHLVHRVVDAHPTGRHPVEVTAATVAFNLDRVKVERILDNLLANALTHTPPGCAVRVSASVEPGGATLVVEDEGPGVPESLRAAILAEGQEPPEGLGMGLWIVVRFARLHGGDVTIEPVDGGGGARFVVWLPARDR